MKSFFNNSQSNKASVAERKKKDKTSIFERVCCKERESGVAERERERERERAMLQKR